MEQFDKRIVLMSPNQGQFCFCRGVDGNIDKEETHNCNGGYVKMSQQASRGVTVN